MRSSLFLWYVRLPLSARISFAASTAMFTMVVFCVGTVRLTSPRLQCSRPIVDFGHRQSGTSVDIEYIVHNTGWRGLQVRSVESDCGCVVSHVPDSPIAPGKSASISVRFLLKHIRGPQQRSLVVHTNESGRNVHQLQIHGFVDSIVQVEPAKVFVPEDSQWPRLVLRASGSVLSLKVTAVSCWPSEICQWKVVPGPDPACCVIELAPGKSGETPSGGQLVITTDVPNEEKIFVPIHFAEPGASPQSARLDFNMERPSCGSLVSSRWRSQHDGVVSALSNAIGNDGVDCLGGISRCRGSSLDGKYGLIGWRIAGLRREQLLLRM